MNCTVTALDKYDIINLHGDLKVNTLPLISPELSNYITANPRKDLILSLAQVNFIDSSTIKLFVNLHKRMEANKKRLYLLRPSEDVVKILCDVKLDTVLALVETHENLETSLAEAAFSGYVPFSSNEGGLHRMSCTCPVCGSANVHGYLVNTNSYTWKWDNDRLFPESFLKSTAASFDAMGLLPIVCADCLLCSVNIDDFTMTSDDHEPIGSSLSDDVKLLLSKTAKNRSKMMESVVEKDDNYFINPRQPSACFNLFLLAESCAKALAGIKGYSTPFWVGYLNYWAMKYASSDKKEYLINTCRTWMAQVLNEKANYNLCQLAKASFIALVCAISLQKPKEAEKIYADFSAQIDVLPASFKNSSLGIDNPLFWFSQAASIWKKEKNASSNL